MARRMVPSVVKTRSFKIGNYWSPCYAGRIGSKRNCEKASLVRGPVVACRCRRSLSLAAHSPVLAGKVFLIALFPLGPILLPCFRSGKDGRARAADDGAAQVEGGSVERDARVANAGHEAKGIVVVERWHLPNRPINHRL